MNPFASFHANSRLISNSLDLRTLIYYSFDTNTVSGTTLNNVVSGSYSATLGSGLGLDISSVVVRNGSGSLIARSGGGLVVSSVALTSITAYSMSIWIYINKDSGKNGRVIEINPSTNDRTLYLLANKLIMFFSPSTTALYPFPYERWTHVGYTYDGTTSKIYINGFLDTTNTTGTFIPSNNFQLNIACKTLGSTNDYFDGYLDDFKLFNKTLSADEMYKVYNIDSTAYSVTNLARFRFPTYSNLSFTIPTGYKTMSNYYYNITSTNASNSSTVYNQNIQPFILTSPTITAYSTAFTTDGAGHTYGFAISSPGSSRLAIFARDADNGGAGPLAYSRITNGSWSAIAALTPSFDVTPPGGVATNYCYIGCAITGNGYRIVVNAGKTTTENKLYWADSSGVFKGTSTAVAFKQISTPLTSLFYCISMMADGSRFVAVDASNINLNIGTWNGTTYITTQLSTSSAGKCLGVAMSTDGSIIATATITTPYALYWSAWNGTAYNSLSYIGNISTGARGVALCGNTMIVSAPFMSTAQYSLWNGSTFGPIINIATSSISSSWNNWGVVIDASNVFYSSNYGGTTVYKNTITFGSPPYFTPYTTINKTVTNTVGCGMAASGTKRMFIYSTFTSPGISYLFSYDGSFSNIVSPGAGSISYQNTPPGTTNNYCCSISKDATKLVMTFGTAYNNQTLHWADASGIFAGTSTTFAFKTIDSVAKTYLCTSITPNGSRLLVATGTYMYFYNWGGSGFGTANQTLDTRSFLYNSCCISADANYIAYGAAKTFYWAQWNGTNYNSGTQIDVSCNGGEVRGIDFANKTHGLLVTTNGTSLAQYSLWNGEKYTAFQDISSGFYPNNVDAWGLQADTLMDNVYWSSPFGSANIHNFSFRYGSAPVFSNYTTLTGISHTTDSIGMGITAPGAIRLAVFGKLTTNFKYARILNGVWQTEVAPTAYNFDVSPSAQYPNYVCTISQTNNRMIICCGPYTGSLLYWGDASGLYAGTSTTISLKQIDSTARNYTTAALTETGNRMVVAVSSGVIYFSTWTGTGYGALTAILETTTRAYRCIDITRTGDRIVYGAVTSIYWSVWNGTNYSVATTAPGTIVGTEITCCTLVGKNSDVVLVTSNSNNVQTCVWGGVNYSTFSSLSTTQFIASGTPWGLCTDISYNIYYAPYSDGNIYLSSCTYIPSYFNYYITTGLTGGTGYKHRVDTIYDNNMYASASNTAIN